MAGTHFAIALSFSVHFIVTTVRPAAPSPRENGQAERIALCLGLSEHQAQYELAALLLWGELVTHLSLAARRDAAFVQPAVGVLSSPAVKADRVFRLRFVDTPS